MPKYSALMLLLMLLAACGKNSPNALNVSVKVDTANIAFKSIKGELFLGEKNRIPGANIQLVDHDQFTNKMLALQPQFIAYSLKNEIYESISDERNRFLELQAKLDAAQVTSGDLE